MDSHAQLRQILGAERERLSAAVPPDWGLALVALTRVRDSWYLTVERSLAPTAIEIDKTRRYVLGWNRALQLCFEHAPCSPPRPSSPDGDPDEWADQMIQDCGRLGEAELVLSHAENGFLQLQQADERTFDAWGATRQMPTEWREREDFAWWTAALARHAAPELDALLAAGPEMRRRLALLPRGATPADLSTTDPAVDEYYRRLGSLYTRRMANQVSYPPDAAIGGVSFQLYLDVLGLLIAWMLKHLDWGDASGYPRSDATLARPGLASPQSEERLAESIVAALGIDRTLARRALGSWTLDRENAAYHSAMPGSPEAPFLRLDDDRLLWSAAGLLTAPLLFLTRELRRRHAREYHDTAYLRENVFRQDLYGLFQDRRFVKSPARVELRRDGDDARTDLDALVFDRKSGSLGIFELKAHDPFPRSAEERRRQRENFYHANRQVSAIAQWLQRDDATGLLARVDPRAARTFRVQRVYLFVLGRYVAHFADGPVPDRRAAWGTWPQVLRLVGERPFGPSDSNPLGALQTRLVKDTPLSPPAADPSTREIRLGAGRIRVYPSFAAYKTAVS